MSTAIPKDYSRFKAGSAHLIAHESCVGWANESIESHGSLYQWAQQQPERRELGGRVPAYSVTIPGQDRRVVVRHSHHGGWLGRWQGDLFLPPTRAPYELLISHLLGGLGVRTPLVVAIAVYPVRRVLRRSDIVTLELPGRDLGHALRDAPDPDVRRGWVDSTAALIRSLTAIGAWHPDLNVGNVLLVESGPAAWDAYVLDIDRLQFAPPSDPNVRDANLDRLERSNRKLRSIHGAGFSDDEFGQLRALAGAAAPA
ncbi:MAG TPA: lipopolysaccharide kinase InaA family protein [Gemmatimonadaceae bacterium]